jgi:hypothetical protein
MPKSSSSELMIDLARVASLQEMMVGCKKLRMSSSFGAHSRVASRRVVLSPHLCLSLRAYNYAACSHIIVCDL